MDWNNMQAWQYFALAGGGVLLLGLVLYFLPAGKTKIPGVVTAAFGGLGAGLALGILFMAGFGYKPARVEVPTDTDNVENARPRMMGAPGSGGGGGAAGGPKASDPRVQLASLVTALDRVADRPVTITLTADQRAALAEQLKGLDTVDQVSEESAQAKVNAIHKIVEKDRAALEAVGYPGLVEDKGGRLPGGPPKSNPGNPFKAGTAAERLKSLLDRLAKK